MGHIKRIGEMLNESAKDVALKNCDTREADVIAREIYDGIAKYAKRSSRDVVTVRFSCGNAGYGDRPFGSGCEERQRRGECYVTYTIEVLNMQYEVASERTMKDILGAFVKLAKGDRTMDVAVRETGSYPDYYEVPTEAVVVKNVSKEFVRLQKYLLKYAGFELQETACYSAPTSGKRGHYEEDIEERVYFCLDGRRCAEFLDKLKSAKSSKDTLSVETAEESDTSDREYSQYYETECYGSVVRTVKAVVKSPSGKVKATLFL